MIHHQRLTVRIHHLALAKPFYKFRRRHLFALECVEGGLLFVLAETLPLLGCSPLPQLRIDRLQPVPHTPDKRFQFVPCRAQPLPHGKLKLAVRLLARLVCSAALLKYLGKRGACFRIGFQEQGGERLVRGGGVGGVEGFSNARHFPC